MELKGNKGEWGEAYAFFKILSEKRIYTADANYNRTAIFLNVLSLIREEVAGFVYRYCTGDEVIIKLNNEEVLRMPNVSFIEFTRKLWNLIDRSETAMISDAEIETFMRDVFVTKLKSPAQRRTDYFGGTIDIMVETQDESGVVRELGFSCKTDLSHASTLFNASGDNTNFWFELIGDFNDAMMDNFNQMFKKTSKACYVATSERIKYLKRNGIDLKFYNPVSQVTKQNLVMCGGLEMPAIIGGMLKLYYFINDCGKTSVKDCINYLTESDPVGYGFGNLEETYSTKIGQLLHCMFTGLKMSKPWNGKSEVNGGYVVVKSDGDVIAYHSTVADEFKDFLINNLALESPSHQRHKDMVIEKRNGRYYLKLALQLRFLKLRTAQETSQKESQEVSQE